MRCSLAWFIADSLQLSNNHWIRGINVKYYAYLGYFDLTNVCRASNQIVGLKSGNPAYTARHEIPVQIRFRQWLFSSTVCSDVSDNIREGVHDDIGCMPQWILLPRSEIPPTNNNAVSALHLHIKCTAPCWLNCVYSLFP